MASFVCCCCCCLLYNMIQYCSTRSDVAGYFCSSACAHRGRIEGEVERERERERAPRLQSKSQLCGPSLHVSTYPTMLAPCTLLYTSAGKHQYARLELSCINLVHRAFVRLPHKACHLRRPPPAEAGAFRIGIPQHPTYTSEPAVSSALLNTLYRLYVK